MMTTRCVMIIGLGMALLQACASRSTIVTETDSTEDIESPAPSLPGPPFPSRESSVSRDSSSVPAKAQEQTPKPVASLLAKAESEKRAGRLDRSAASLERAIRIDPRNPIPWHKLARIRLKQGHPKQAESMATKSNSLVSPDTQLASENWKIIAEARRQLGDHKGSQEATQRARQ